MGSLSVPLPQGPMTHCGKLEPHDKHPNTTNTVVTNAWCDGVTPLEPFVELTIRVPLTTPGFSGTSHVGAVKFLGQEGLGMFVSYLDHPETMLVLRVRTEDHIDKVYPVIRNKSGRGFKAVEMPDGQ